eukprot:TCONS_00021954-protein
MEQLFLKIMILYLIFIQRVETSNILQDKNVCSNENFYLRKVEKRTIKLKETPIEIPGIQYYQQCFAQCQKHQCSIFDFRKPVNGENSGSCSVYPGKSEKRTQVSTRFVENGNHSFFERVPCPLEKPEKSIQGTFKEAKSCSDVKNFGGTQSGLYEINETIKTSSSNHLQYILCNMNELGGGWTTIMHNQGDITFAGDWEAYKQGFGDYRKSFWAGNNFIHQLTANEDTELLVILKDDQSVMYYGHYKTFFIGDEGSNYKLTIGQHREIPGVINLPQSVDDQFYVHNRAPFSTKDKDWSSKECAIDFDVGWWFTGCYKVDLVSQVCGEETNYLTGNSGIHWHDAKNSGWENYCFTESTMLVRKHRN